MRSLSFIMLLLLSFSVLAPKPAVAMYMTSADLARTCLSERSQDIYACTNYIAGVVDYHVLMQSFGTAPTIDFCMPDYISMQQAAVIVMAYMRTAPQNDDFIAATVVPLALHKAFPCTAKTVKKKKK